MIGLQERLKVVEFIPLRMDNMIIVALPRE